VIFGLAFEGFGRWNNIWALISILISILRKVADYGNLAIFYPAVMVYPI